MKLGRDGVGSDIFVVRRQRVPRETERAYPESSANVDGAVPISRHMAGGQRVISPEWVQDRAAGLLAGDGLELKKRCLWFLLEGCVEGANRDDKPRCFLQFKQDHVSYRA